MTSLVFLEPNRMDAAPFTTSIVISKFARVSHKYIKKQIVANRKDFETFGLLGAYTTESTGGRPGEYFRLNEEQATFLMTLLKNTPTAVAFKRELVRQFFAMRAELDRRQIRRAELKPIRRELTDAIQDRPNHGEWDFKHYTDLAYKHAIGMNAAQLRKVRGADKKAHAVDYMTAAEIEAVARAQAQISVLYQMGMAYEQVKMLLANSKLQRLPA